MKPKPLIAGLALASLAIAALLPPEAYGEGRMALIVSATFAFIAGLAEGQIPRRYLAAGAGIFGLLILHSLVVSVDRYRSLEFVTVLWAYYCLIGFFMYGGPQLLRPAATVLVALAVVVAGYGLYQYFWGFDQLYAYIFYSNSAAMVKVPALERVATRRVTATFALPGTLWGFLLMALPLQLALWRNDRRIKAALILAAALSLSVGLLTKSFGFLAGLFVLGLAGFWLHGRQWKWDRLRIATALVVVVAGLMIAAAGLAFRSARESAIQESNPLSLRFANWVSAWQMFGEHPLGTGLNTYGVIYPQVMIPGANETQFTHNTALQLMAELGYPVLIGAVVLAAVIARRKRVDLKDPAIAAVVLALAVWIAHNTIDIDVYFPSVGAVGAVLCGLLFSRSTMEGRPAGRWALASTGVFSLLVLAFSTLVFLSTELQHRAAAEYEEHKPLLAAATLESAKRLMPLNASLFHDSGEVLLDLSQKTRNSEYLNAATESFARAAELSPEKAGHHIGLGLCLSQANRIEEAMREIRKARRLYPSGTYAQSIARLIEQRRVAATP